MAEPREVSMISRDGMANIIMSAIPAGMPVMQLFSDSSFNAAGTLVFKDFSLIDRSVSCIKLAITGYHATHTPGSEWLGYLYVGGCSIHLCVIAFHLDKNYRSWVRIRIVGTAVLVMVGKFLFIPGMIINHAWYSTVVHMTHICVVLLEAGLFVRSEIKKDVGNKKLLHDLLIIFFNMLTTSYHLVGSLGKTHSPWDAEKFLNLFGISLSVVVGVGQIACIAFKMCINTHRVSAGEEEQATRGAMWGNGGRDAGGQVEDEGVEMGNSIPVTIGASQSQVVSTPFTAGIMPKVVKWLKNARGVSAREEEQAARAAMSGSGGRDVGGHVEDEGVEMGNSMPVTIGASQVGSTACTAGMMPKVIEWLKKARGVSAVEEEQARPAVAAMEANGVGDAGQQVADEDFHVVVASPA